MALVVPMAPVRRPGGFITMNPVQRPNMPAKTTILFLLLTLTVGPTAGKADEKTNAKQAAERLFTLKVFPLLKTKCFGCHGADAKDVRGQFNLMSRAGMLNGGESEEPALIPAKPDESPLYKSVLWEGLEMPPKENDRLTKVETDYVRAWIAAGAPWPDAKTQTEIRKKEWSVRENKDGIIVTTSGGLADNWTYRRYQKDDLWAFLPIKETTRPKGDQNPIDAFLNARLNKAGLKSAQAATPHTLMRRATLDLTGLPPTPEEIKTFQKAYRQDKKRAWTELVDRLLSSPRYGERWGRHWLDVTRYSDTGGMSNDYERSNMWRYRDYVIRSFNKDKPYNRFIIEQLAGDELADNSVRKRKGNDKAVQNAQMKGAYTQEEAEWIVATGFLRLGPWDNAMIAQDEARQIYLDDLVNITGQTFLAQTLRCCKCHDHKFDPIPTKDYYRIYAAFATTHMAERKVPFLSVEDRSGFKDGKAHVERMLAYAREKKEKLINKRETAARAWYKEHGLPYKNDKQRKNDPDDQKPPRHVGMDYIDQGRLKVREQDEWIWNRRLERYQPMAQSVYNAPATVLAWNGARKLRIKGNRNSNRKPDATHILLGGALSAKGGQVQPGVLSGINLPVNASSKKPLKDPYVVESGVDGRRLALAKWIASPNNSLTTRAIVNRIWQYHFGVGIAANANNFGAKGSKPTHPELLDYLATDFVQHGWKIKRMHRAIMLSDAYRRATVPADKRVDELDPNNRLLSYFPRRRLAAEELRDGILAITGELVHTTGGVPVMPDINMEVALQPRMIQFSLAPAYQPSPTPDLRNRRTIYAYHVRGQADPFNELFNQPNPNESCDLRESAAVTPQVFMLLNSDTMTDRSIALALRLQREQEQLREQINRAFELVLGRFPTEAEATNLSKYAKEMVQYHKQEQPGPSRYPTEITRSLVEEFSGRPFKYKEILPIFAAYQPDKKAADVAIETRALADVCLLLFNTNEFMYVQ